MQRIGGSSVRWEAEADAGTPSPQADAKVLHRALHRGLSSLGADEVTLFHLLADRSTEHLDAVARVYAATFGEPLDARLRLELGPRDFLRARMLLSGDGIQRWVERLHLSVLDRDAQCVLRTLEAMPVSLLRAVRERFAGAFGALELAVLRLRAGAARERALLLLRRET